MTTLQFRQNPTFTGRLREILSDEVMQEALMALHDANLPKETADGADAIESVRRHSRSVGRNEILAELLLMADPVPVPPVEEEATYEQT